MKKAITVILAIFLILSLAACANETVNSPEPTGSPSEAPTPEPTDAPTEAPTPTPESSPTPDDDRILKGGRDFWVALENGVTYYCDIDGDGLVDSVLFSEEASNEYYRVYYVTITMGADPYNPYEYHTGETTWGCAWIIDSDPDDGRLEVLVTNEGQSGDPESAIYRAISGGDEIEKLFTGGVKLNGQDPESFVFSSEEGFEVVSRSFVLGSNDLSARVRVGADGIELLSGVWTFARPHEYTLKLELPVTLLNEDGTEGESYTVPVGETITPVYTDDDYAVTYAVVRLGDGRLAKIEIEMEQNLYYINGIHQMEYADFIDEG